MEHSYTRRLNPEWGYLPLHARTAGVITIRSNSKVALRVRWTIPLYVRYRFLQTNVVYTLDLGRFAVYVVELAVSCTRGMVRLADSRWAT